jgi:hypothetical protein
MINKLKNDEKNLYFLLIKIVPVVATISTNLGTGIFEVICKF